ncbi:hypothetical protein AAMO2058_001581900 [Amorphochlora amoebiformis]
MKQIGSLNFTIKSSTRKPGEILPVWKKLFGNGLFMVGSDQWKRMHKIAIRGMGSNKMRLYLPSILQSADRVIGTLESQALDAKEKGEKKFAVNTTVLFRNYATEAIMKVGFGESLNKEEILKLGKKFAHAMELGSEPQSMFNAYLMLPLESNKKLWRDIDELHAVGKALVNKFRDKDTGSLLQALCEASDGDEMFTEDECVHNVYSFIGAGIDTTSTALTHCVTLMALYPDIQEKGFLPLTLICFPLLLLCFPLQRSLASLIALLLRYSSFASLYITFAYCSLAAFSCSSSRDP